MAIASNATLTNVNDSDSVQTLLAVNGLRVGVVIMNDSDQTLYVKFGSAATSTSFTYKLVAGATLELPTAGTVNYTGLITGIWAANSTGAARITELLAA